MKSLNLTMPPFNTTFMGVVKGALDYYGSSAETPFVYGASGHAFLVNIHEQLCPSGPYVWQRDPVVRLIRNLGLDMADLGFFSAQSSHEARRGVEAQLCAALDAGIACSLLNLEHQMITGYEAGGDRVTGSGDRVTGFFITAQPWAPHVDFPPARLTFGSWTEFGDEVHVDFYLLRRIAPAEQRRAVIEGLDYAVDLYAHPERHSSPGYGIGPHAYANWIRAIPEFGASHGNWWNATVWGECRQMASRHLAGIAQSYPEAAGIAEPLAVAYGDLAATLHRVGEKALPADEKIALLTTVKAREAAAIEGVAALADSLR